MSERPPFASGRVLFKARLRSVFSAVCALSGMAFVWHRLFAKRGVRILAYHGVETPPTNPFAVAVENFEAQIAHISKRYDVMDLAAFLGWQAGVYQSDKEKIVLTFDDGFKNNLKYAAPILERYAVPATFFIIGSKLEGEDGRFMTTKEAAALLDRGSFRIGSHTLNHLSVTRITDTERERELGGSRAVLEEKLGGEIDLFCYPYGTFNDFDKHSVGCLKRYGYKLACTSVNGINFKGTDPFRLRRTKVEWSDDVRTFRRLLGGAMDGWILVDFFFRFLQRPRAVRFNEAGNTVSGVGGGKR